MNYFTQNVEGFLHTRVFSTNQFSKVAIEVSFFSLISASYVTYLRSLKDTRKRRVKVDHNTVCRRQGGVREVIKPLLQFYPYSVSLGFVVNERFLNRMQLNPLILLFLCMVVDIIIKNLRFFFVFLHVNIQCTQHKLYRRAHCALREMLT